MGGVVGLSNPGIFREDYYSGSVLNASLGEPYLSQAVSVVTDLFEALESLLYTPTPTLAPTVTPTHTHGRIPGTVRLPGLLGENGYMIGANSVSSWGKPAYQAYTSSKKRLSLNVGNSSNSSGTRVGFSLDKTHESMSISNTSPYYESLTALRLLSQEGETIAVERQIEKLVVLSLRLLESSPSTIEQLYAHIVDLELENSNGTGRPAQGRGMFVGTKELSNLISRTTLFGSSRSSPHDLHGPCRHYQLIVQIFEFYGTINTYV